MELDKSIYQDPNASAEALTALGPFMTLFYVGLGIAILILCYALVRFMNAQRKLKAVAGTEQPRGKRAGMGEVVAQKAKKGEVETGDYAGLTREEMRMVFEAEVKRRRAAGEEVVVKNLFEGPLDWDDMDETGAPRVRAEKAPDFEEWFRQQRAAKAEAPSATPPEQPAPPTSDSQNTQS
ncbi:MAG: hypothetical protein ABI743_03060 [bacterium]